MRDSVQNLVRQQLQKLADAPYGAVITVAAGAANIAGVTIQVNDFKGDPIAYPVNLVVFLSKTTYGLTYTDHVADTITASTGVIWQELVAACAVLVRTDATGLAVLVVTDTHKTGQYVVVLDPISQKVLGYGTITATTDYGA